MGWYKGNTHTHTNDSDGDSPAEEVIAWYREHRFNFLVLSNHNFLTDTSQFRHLEDESFLLIAGVEVSDVYDGRPLHINGLNVERLTQPRHGDSLVATLQNDVDEIIEVGGLPHINHPNFFYAFGSEEIGQVTGNRHFEIYNGHPLVYNEGDAEQGHPGVEQMWDDLLTAGEIMYGVAVDDAHHFQTWGPERANPGRGWVWVESEALDCEAIIAAMQTGSFYCSTGVELAHVRNDGEGIELEVKDPDDPCLIEFICNNGEVVESIAGHSASFVPRSVHCYVRTRVTASDGKRAWLQPVFTDHRV